MNNNLDEINKENVLNNVPADESQTHCPICQEKFEQYWSTEQEEWIYKDSISIAGVIYHQQCTKLQNPNINPPIKEESSIPPLESHDTTSSNLLPQKRTRETEDVRNKIIIF